MGVRHARGHGHDHHHHHLRSRTLHLEIEGTDQLEARVADMSGSEARDALNRLMARTNNLDEKPVGNSMTVPIALGVCIPLVMALCVLVYLHRRSQVRQRMEDETDKYKSMDFGLDDKPVKSKRKSAFLGMGKDSNHKAQLSMDMNLSSPYLLPPHLQNSRESMNSLAKTIHQSEDPYRSVTSFMGNGTVTSPKTALSRDSSMTTNKTRSSGPPSAMEMPPQKSVPTGPLPDLPPAVQMPQRAEIVDAPTSPKNEFRFVDDSQALAQVPEIQEPPAVAAQVPRIGVAQASRPISAVSMKAEEAYVTPLINEPQTSEGLGIVDPTLSKESSVPAAGAPVTVIEPSNASDFDDYTNNIQVSAYDEDELHMQQPAVPHSAGLGVPTKENRRLSVGLRPLPPDDFLESEDPEFRANRIRSFYKEYFEDGAAKTDAGKPPPIPQQPNYYEDYDNNYYGEAAYFDPDTNAFVMPYAQPVTRRAMTPPPSSRRPMPGPRQRGPHGSIGGMPGGPRGPPRGPGGPMGRPRAGSTVSTGRWAPMSPRPDSSASNPRYAAKPKRPLPPPVDLNTLPTPSKLKDDSFALSGVLDFAPPPTIKDQAAGRSQSPVGERRPYVLNTPIHSPLVSAFEETAALPSPHLLRKSGTFTALDFAPPRRFKDPETMSDAGSIRSNGSGISSAQLSAIRNGAGRVSRLPGDTVFTQNAASNTLKPSWNMRD
ncbi:hypothetical protein F4775DRAFT_327501 [Biscogniauxia sp. FL1348]|nr:hypothetical protein F4775DRAFT_327501 [Biscogniauxia sp. FL1348]